MEKRIQDELNILWNKKTMPVDVIVSRENKFNKRKSTSTIEQQIAQEGIILYG